MLIDEIKVDDVTYQLCHTFSCLQQDDWFWDDKTLKIRLGIQKIEGERIELIIEDSNVDFVIYRWIHILATSMGYYDSEAYKKDKHHSTMVWTKAKNMVQEWYGISIERWFPYDIPRGYDYILTLVESGESGRYKYCVRSYTQDGWLDGQWYANFRETTYQPGKYLIAEHAQDGTLKRIFTYRRSETRVVEAAN
jgi:hypothetical protein